MDWWKVFDTLYTLLLEYSFKWLWQNVSCVPHILSKRHRSVTLFKYSGPQTSLRKMTAKILNGFRCGSDTLRQTVSLLSLVFIWKRVTAVNRWNFSQRNFWREFPGLSRQQSITHLRLILHCFVFFMLQIFLDLLFCIQHMQKIIDVLFLSKLQCSVALRPSASCSTLNYCYPSVTSHSVINERRTVQINTDITEWRAAIRFSKRLQRSQLFKKSCGVAAARPVIQGYSILSMLSPK